MKFRSSSAMQAAFGMKEDLAFIRARAAGVAGASGTGHADDGVARASDDGPIVLIATGTFNPPHRGHVEMIRVARQALVDAGCSVAGAVLVPSSDKYVRRKVLQAGLDPSLALGFQLRAQLLLASAEDLDLEGFVHISDAEQSRGLFYLDTPKSLAKALGGDLLKPRFVFVTGSDRACPFVHRFPGLSGCVVVPRAGDDISELQELLDGDPLRSIAPAAEGTEDLSSTRLREALLEALSLEQTGPSAAEGPAEAAETALLEFMTPSAARACLGALGVVRET